MSFQDKIQIILPVLQGYYIPYVTKEGAVPAASDPERQDYDKIRGANIHGGVDLLYGQMIGQTLTWLGSGASINNHPFVHAPVSGQVIKVDPSNGQVSILCNGYVHTIYHMREISVEEGQTITEETVIGKMDGMYGGSPTATPHHVHYEITTYLYPDRESKIDPEAFWNNDGTNRPFALTGSFKKGNIFYGTSNNEILEGEGKLYERDTGGAIEPSDNDTLSGGGGSDIIDGKDGDDKLYGGNSYGKNKYYEIPVTGPLAYYLNKHASADSDTSTDYLIGGMGKDYLDGGKGDDYLYGGVAMIANGQVTPYNESEDTDTSRDTLIGGEGNDVMYGGKGDDWLIGGQGNDVMYGGEDDDFLFGGLDNDVMYGGKGNDVFWGDQGNDVMYGGLGNDTYFINAGDGNDTIEDKDGDNTVILCDELLKFFYNTGDNETYISADGWRTLEKSTGILTDAENNIIVTLNQNFEEGDFGIDLITLPANPATENTINGDLAPVDMDPETAGVQYGYDQWGNVITDPLQPSPGREDFFYDTSADDKIICGGGDDQVDCENGGANWILGEDGNDAIDADLSSSCIIEGGAGSDIIVGGENGNNQLFGDSRGGDGALATVMATHIDEGEEALDSGTRGDIVAADGENNNFLFGSNGYDIMWGYKGKDVIVAGGGNDLIIGDGGGIGIYIDDLDTWSFHIEYDGNTYTPVITGLYYYDMESSVDNDDVIYTGTGNDFVDAGGGDDEVYGGTGNDTILGIEGDDFIEGGEGDDTLIGDNGPYLPLEFNGNDYIDGGAGDDSIQGDGGSDELFGGADNDLLDGGEGDDYLDGGTGNDLLAGLAGDDYLDGGSGLNTLYGGAGNDIMFGGDDGNLIIGESGADEIYGGAGNDSLHGDASDTPLGEQGDDYIDGGAGDNLIYGYGGNNTLYGGDDNDQISADDGDDYIDGGDGANTLIGGDGNNDIYAGTGDDQILGGSNSDYIDAGDGNNIVQSQDGDDVISTGTGNDSIWGGAGADAIYGGAGNDYIYADDGNEFDAADIVDGEEGDDTIIGAGGDDELYGGGGNDFVQGDVGASTGNDYLDGGAGADTLLGQAGDDILYGGTGNDTMQGDSGSDAYIFGRGDGADIINNNAADYATAIDTIQINAAINDVTMTIEGSYLDLRISINGTDDSLLIWNWGSDPSYQADQIIFSDGTVLTPDQLQDYLANKINGTSGDNTLSGGTGIDAMYGYAGNDNLSAGDGNDVLTGGVGNDTLVGGAGNDAYVFNIGDGVDTIDDISTVAEGNTIYFGQGITPGDISVVKNGTTLTINVGSGGDAINLLNFDENEITGSLVTSAFQFADGTALAPTDFMNLNPPVVLDPIPDQTTAEEAPFSFTVPDYTFYDFDINDTLTYSATKSDGTALPSWLTFDPETMTFSGTPPDAGILSIKVTATDAVGHSVSDDFDITVTNDVNDAPVVAHPIADQIGKEDTPFNFIVPGNTFSDVDPGDTLTYSATKSDGSALPSWLAFDPGTMTFSGTPASGDLEGLSLRVTATDLAGASVFDDFNVREDNPPVVANPIDDQNATEDAVFSFTVPSNTFSDVDPGDTLTYSATSADGTALPSWLTFDPETMIFSGTPANDNVGILPLKVTATDAAGASASDEFNVTVINTNDAPVVSNPIADQTTMEDAVFSFTVPGNTFVDLDLGDTLTYSATLADGSALPSWLTFDPGTRTFSGTAVGIGTNSIKVTATDNAGASVSASFNLEVQINVIIGTENDDHLIGTIHQNIIYGLGGNDTIDGREDADTMVGGAGDDTYIVDNIGDVVTENANEGTDTVQSSVSYTLGADIENLTLTGIAAISGTGNELDNVIIGNDAENVLTGGKGNDTIYGGAGNDSYSYHIGDGLDRISDVSGSDTLVMGSGITYNQISLRMDGAIGRLRLLDAGGNETSEGMDIVLNPDGSIPLETIRFADGSSYNMSDLIKSIYGTNGMDLIITGGGKDLIHALGGVDFVYSGQGDDTIYGGDGIDLLCGDGGNDLIYGENDSDALFGCCGNDTLDGGSGVDVMLGGTGDDAYIVDDACDVVTEFFNQGTDTVLSSVTFTLGSNVENLTLTGTAAINGTGNTVDNVLTGNSANNTLSGGAGNDTLDGGAGNDSLIGGTGNDIYAFMRGDGQDTITDYDTTAGNSDKVKFGSGINPIDLILGNNGNNLDVQVNNSSDLVTVQNQNSDSANQVEVFEAGDGSQLLSSQVGLLIQAMADLSTQNSGMSWTELIQNKPADVQQILAQYWQPSN